MEGSNAGSIVRCMVTGDCLKGDSTDSKGFTMMKKHRDTSGGEGRR